MTKEKPLVQKVGMLDSAINLASKVPFLSGFLEKRIVKLAELDDDAAKAVLQKLDKNVEDFVTATGEISIEALKGGLNAAEKIKFFIISSISDYLGAAFVERSKAPNVKGRDFDEHLEDLETMPLQGVEVLDGKNVVLAKGGGLGMMGSMVSLLQLDAFQGEQVEEGKDKITFPTRCRFVLPMDNDNPEAKKKRGVGEFISNYVVMRKAFEKVGIKLTVLVPGEAITAPAADETQLIYSFADEVPMKGGKVDNKKLDWFIDLYESGVGTNWLASNKLLAAMFVRKGETVHEAASKAKVPLDDELRKNLEMISPASGGAPDIETSTTNPE